MTFYLSPKHLQDALSVDKCPENLHELCEHSQLLDYDVVRYKSEWDSKDPDLDDEWIAPELACFAMKDIFTAGDGPWNRKTVVSLKEGEPSSSLFEIPPDFVERSPDQLNALWKSTFGAPFLPDNALANLQSQYNFQRTTPQ
jgi:hypothetical protein